MTTSFYAGRRLSYSGSLCTVRYCGPVQGTKGDWLGVEWDDPTKGKHSGEHDGVKHFECLSKEPTAGSFVRPTRPFDQPLSFLGALHKKYASDHDVSTGTKPNSSSEQSIEISGKIVEEVGFDKIRRQRAILQELQTVLLDGLYLAGLESNPWPKDRDHNYWLQQIKKLTEVCPKIVELDLSRNLIENWMDVVGICKALPMLRSLKLNGNRFKCLSTSECGDSELCEAFEGIKELYFDDTIMTWEDITSLTSSFPTLTTLSLSSNQLSTIPSNLSTANITTLSLSTNNFTALASLEPLAHLPNLQVLSLRSNKINTITPPGTSQPIFPSLHTLDLSHNAIPSLSFISHLPHTLPALTSLRTSNNPFTTTLSIEEAYILVLARISTLTSLNYSKITPAERTNAELYYLSSIGKQLSSLPVEEEPAVLSSQHPRYAELCALHGAPTITRSSTTSSNPNINTLEARLINFTFYLPAHELAKRHLIPGIQRSNPQTPNPASSTNSDESWEQQSRIPRTVTPYRLKALVGDLFDLPPMYLRLTWETGEWDPVGWSLAADDDARWSVSSEDEEAEDEDFGNEEEGGRRKGKWVRREVELVDGTREVGFWIEEREARVRVEVRERPW